MTTTPTPEHLLLISAKAAELKALINGLGPNPSAQNPHPDGFPDTPWSPLVLATLCSDLATLARFCENDALMEAWGVTDEVMI